MGSPYSGCECMAKQYYFSFFVLISFALSRHDAAGVNWNLKNDEKNREIRFILVNYIATKRAFKFVAAAFLTSLCVLVEQHFDDFMAKSEMVFYIYNMK